MSNLLNERLAVGQSIATPLRALEAQIDSAIEQAGHVMVAMAQGRKRARVAAATGHEAFSALGKTVNALFEGRGTIVACHQSLEQTRRELNVPTRSYGDEASKPTATLSEASQPLRSVA
jgi:hypothetical protein